MKVLLFPRFLAKSGVGNFVRVLAAELYRQGHDVVIVCGFIELDLSTLPKSIKIYHVETCSINPLNIVENLRAIHKIIIDENIEIVHCQHRIPAIYMSIYNFFYNRVRTIYTLHLVPVPCDFVHRLMTCVGDKAVGVSSDCSSFLIEKLKIPAKKTVTILNGVNENELSLLSDEEKNKIFEKYHIPKGKYIIVQHCRIDPVKNHLLLIKAASIMPERIRSKYVFVCSGKTEGKYYDECISLIKKLGVESNFIFTNWIKARDILGIADFMVLPSLIEGFGLNTLESFIMGVPVARTRGGGYSDTKNYCIPISGTDVSELVNLIIDICENGTSKYRNMSLAAQQWALRMCTVTAMTKQYIQVYEGH